MHARTGGVCVTQVFNGGSDFNEPIKRCLDRLHTAAWANSDILLVSDGELRQPGSEIMRKLAGEAPWERLASLALLRFHACHPSDWSHALHVGPCCISGEALALEGVRWRSACYYV